jgi:SAM-dependent methyltransferase
MRPETREPTPFDDGPLYDLMCAGCDHGVDFYRDLAKAADGPVLEVACGTGRITLPCLQAGADVDGLDLSPALLDTLRMKAAALGYAPRLHEANMASFRLDRRYALILITFNAFVHNLTADDQIATLVCCREHLKPGGLLAFDGFFPTGAIFNGPDNVRMLESETTHPETGSAIRVFDTRSFDRVDQLMRSLTEVEILDAAGKVEVTHRLRTTIRWIYKGEMELLLRVAGFSRWQIFGGFDRRPLERETDLMIVQAWNDAGDQRAT